MCIWLGKELHTQQVSDLQVAPRKHLSIFDFDIQRVGNLP